MRGIQAFMEKHFVPIAAKFGSNRVLIAIRDSFIGTLPATMAGSIAVMLNAIIRDLPTQFFPAYNGNEIPVIAQIIGVNGFVWNGTLAIAGVIFAISWGYNLSRTFGVEGMPGSLVSLGSLIMGVNFVATTADGETAWGFLQLSHLGPAAIFTAMILGAISVTIYIVLMKKKITIKLPDSVPPAVSKAFTAIIPATAGLYAVAIISYVFSLNAASIVNALNTTANPFTSGFIVDVIQRVIAQPLLGLSQGYGPVAIVTILVSLLWFFGLHGPNVLAPILDGVWGTAQTMNVNAVGATNLQTVREAIAAGQQINGEDVFMWVRGSFDAYAWFGGSGGTITLLIAIFLFSKRADYKTVGKLGVGPGIFNINEPVMFGLPIVLNPMMLIPFFLAPFVATTIGYLATALGLVYPVTQSVVWVVPPFLMSYLATLDWRAPIVTLVSFAASFIIYVPFVIAANAQEETDA